MQIQVEYPSVIVAPPTPIDVIELNTLQIGSLVEWGGDYSFSTVYVVRLYNKTTDETIAKSILYNVYAAGNYTRQGVILTDVYGNVVQYGQTYEYAINVQRYSGKFNLFITSQNGRTSFPSPYGVQGIRYNSSDINILNI